MHRGRHLILVTVKEVALLSANNRVDCEHRRADEQSEQRDHHVSSLPLPSNEMADHPCAKMSVTKATLPSEVQGD